MSRLDDFRAYRTRMNERILGIDHLGIKRFFNLDSAAYRDGLSARERMRAHRPGGKVVRGQVVREDRPTEQDGEPGRGVDRARRAEDEQGED